MGARRRRPGGQHAVADEHADVVVVGSGFGASVAAYRLAEAGRLGDAPQVAALRELDIAPDPVFTAFLPSTRGVLDDHLESVVELGRSEVWLDPPKAATY